MNQHDVSIRAGGNAERSKYWIGPTIDLNGNFIRGFLVSAGSKMKLREHSLIRPCTLMAFASSRVRSDERSLDNGIKWTPLSSKKYSPYSNSSKLNLVLDVFSRKLSKKKASLSEEDLNICLTFRPTKFFKWVGFHWDRELIRNEAVKEQTPYGDIFASNSGGIVISTACSAENILSTCSGWW